MLEKILEGLKKAGETYYGFTKVSVDGKRIKMDCNLINGQWIIREAEAK